MNKFKLILGTGLLCLATAGASLATANTVHYRWLDDRGNPVHSDRPPPEGTDYEVVSTGSGLKRVVSSDEGAVPAEVKPRVGNEFTQVDTNEDARSKKNPELCQRARDNLEALSGDTKVQMLDDQGETRMLSDEEIIAEREKAESLVKVYCP